MKNLTANELKTKRQAGESFTLVNTLSPESFQKTHIPDSINIPLDEKGFEEQVEVKAGGKDKQVVVYCASKECESSSKAAKKLENAGFTKVYDFEGGAKEWQEAGESLEAVAP